MAGKGGSWNRQERGSAEPVEGKCGSKLPKTNPPRYCTQPAGSRTDHSGNGRCWKHGGNNPSGHAHYNLKHGRDSIVLQRIIPQRFAKIYAAERDDGDMMGLEHAIRMAEALEQEALMKLDTGESGARWKQIQEAGKQIETAIATGNAGLLAQAAKDVKAFGDAGAQDHTNVTEYIRLQAHIANLKATQLRYWESRHGTMTPREVLLMMRQLAAIIMEEVKDAQALGRIEGRIAGMLGAGVREASA